jgi:acetyltransferase-like isoleucine patch superfamily enzyme
VWERLRLYLKTQSTGIGRYWVEELLFFLFGWIPTVIGIFTRALIYRLVIRGEGFFAIEKGVMIKQARNLWLGRNVYLDSQAYLHACPQGIRIGEGTRIMHGAQLNVYNFRNLKGSEIVIGKNCVVGSFCLIMGQGGTRIGDDVIIAPRVSIYPMDHNYQDTGKLIREQGITCRGIEIGDNVWIGAGAIILDGVKIGRGSVIGAGAVVSRDIPERSLALGCPARVVRSLGSDK